MELAVMSQHNDAALPNWVRNRDLKIAARVESGLCQVCGEPREQRDLRHCDGCLAAARSRTRKWNESRDNLGALLKPANDVEPGPNALTPEARHLVATHVGLARGLAWRIVRQWHMMGMAEDAVAEGMLGLIEAAKRFDPERGVAFTTYAPWWIKMYVRRYIYHYRHVVHAPKASTIEAVASGLGRKTDKVRQTLGREPTRAELSDALNVPEKTLIRAQETTRPRDEAIAGTGVWEQGMHEPRSSGLTPEDAAAQSEVTRLVDGILRTLDQRTADIIRRRHMSEEPMTQVELAKEYGITRQRIEQIEAKGMAAIRKALRVAA
jgi:RNA polymerase sigma factor (sigma-70 family)